MMIIVTAFAMGCLAVTLRSAFSCAVIGCSILMVFGLAALVSAGAVSWFALVLSVLAYNAGIGGTLVGMSLATFRRKAA